KREVLFEPDDLQREAEAAEGDLSDGDLTDSLIERRDLDAARSTLERALEKINPRYASAIRLRIIEERPREGVAKALGVSTATFDVVPNRAMTALRKATAPNDPRAGDT